MATASGLVVVELNMNDLYEEINRWVEVNDFPSEAEDFVSTALKPIIDKWNIRESLTAWFPALAATYSGVGGTVSGTDQIDELVDTMENYRGGYSLNDSHDLAIGITSTVVVTT